MSRVTHFSRGYVKIRISGKFPERFINLCLSKRIPLWKLVQRNNHIELFTTVAGFKRIRPILKTTECSVKIINKQGLPFILDRMLHYKWLFGCLVLLILLGIWGSMYIWSISINAPANYDTTEIERVLSETGLVKGVLRSRVDPRSISKAIQAEFSEIRWADIRVTGIKADVTIELRPNNADGTLTTGDIVALRDGYLEELIVLDGTALARSGNTITKGQVIVEGKVYSNNLYLHNVAARALIKTSTWYYGNGLASAEYTELQQTGNRSVQFLWKVQGKEGHLYGQRNNYDLYTLQEVSYPLRWRNISTTVEVVKRVYIEQRAVIKELNEEQVKEKAQQAALAAALTQIGPISSPVEISYKYIDLGTMMYVEAILKAYEDITYFSIHQR